jgi:hypothetical protein
VKTPVDELLRAQARAYSLRFACDDCAHFDGEAAVCSLGYPASPRRPQVEAASLEFCKSFELA